MVVIDLVGVVVAVIAAQRSMSRLITDLAYWFGAGSVVGRQSLAFLMFSATATSMASTTGGVRYLVRRSTRDLELIIVLGASQRVGGVRRSR